MVKAEYVLLLKSMVIQIVLNFKDGLLHIKCMEMMD